MATDKEQKKWKDLKGNPTSDDTKTHWDENGFLDIREEYDAEQDTSGVDTDVEVSTTKTRNPLDV